MPLAQGGARYGWLPQGGGSAGHIQFDCVATADSPAWTMDDGRWTMDGAQALEVLNDYAADDRNALTADMAAAG